MKYDTKFIGIIGILFFVSCLLISTVSAASNDGDSRTIYIAGKTYEIFASDEVPNTGEADYIGIKVNTVETAIGASLNGGSRQVTPTKPVDRTVSEDRTLSKDSEDTDELTCPGGMCSIDSTETEEDDEDKSTVTNTETTKLNKEELIAFFDVNTCTLSNSINDTEYAFGIKQKLADENVSSGIVSVTLVDGTEIYMNEIELEHGDVATVYCDGVARDVLTLKEGKKIVTKRLCSVCPLRTTGKEVISIFRDSSDN